MCRVSIIIPMFNAECYIERCARSLFMQSFDELELIFIDDCSTDNTVAVLERVIQDFPQRSEQIKTLFLVSNQGVANARQQGLNLATGEFVTQIDADDYVSTDYVEMMKRQADETCADIVICDFVYVRDNEKQHIHVNPPALADECLARIMTGEMHSGFMNKLVRRSLYSDNNLTMVPGLNIMEDKVMMLKLFSFASKVAYVGKPMYFYDKTNSASITSQNRARQVPSLAKAWDEVEDFCRHMAMNQRLEQALEYYRIGLLGSVLYFAQEPIRQLKPSLVARPALTDIFKQPVIPLNYKLILVCYSLHLTPAVRLVKWLKERLS